MILIKTGIQSMEKAKKFVIYNIYCKLFKIKIGGDFHRLFYDIK